MERFKNFFQEIDAAWRPLGSSKQALHIIGSAALMLQCDFDRSTKDADLLETQGLDGRVKTQLLHLAGRSTPLCARHRMYIEVIPSGLPFLAQKPIWRRHTEINAVLRCFEIQVLDVVDVVVYKLKRFHAHDKADVRANGGPWPCLSLAAT